MLRVAVAGLGALVISSFSLSVGAQSITGVAVSGGSSEVFPAVLNTPSGDAFIQLNTTSLESTRIDFTKDVGEVVFPLTLGKFNQTGEIWRGLTFTLEGAFFTAAPFEPFLGGTGVIFGPDNNQAELLVPIAGLTGVNLDITFGIGTSGALTVTPLVPEPTTGLAMATALSLIGRRGRG